MVGAGLGGPPAASDHEPGHRPQVALIGFQGAHQLLGAGFFDRGRVEGHHLQAGFGQAGQQRAVVVAGGLDAHPADQRLAGRLSPGDLDQQAGHPGLGQGKLERFYDHLTEMVGDQRHRRPLSDVDGHDQTAGAVEVSDPGHVLGLEGPADETGHAGCPARIILAGAVHGVSSTLMWQQTFPSARSSSPMISSARAATSSTIG